MEIPEGVEEDEKEIGHKDQKEEEEEVGGDKGRLAR